MPTPKLPDDVLIQALNLVEEFGSGHLAEKAGCGLPRNTIDHRMKVALAKGLKPTFRKDAPRVYERHRLGRMHLIIPDCQVRPGVPLDFLEWVGRYIAQKQPDVIVCIGDFADLPALSKYDVGTIRGENKRLKRDLDVARQAMDKLTAPFRDIAGYKPEMHFTMGNHEERLDRFANEHPYLEEVVGSHMLNYEEWGWKVHPFLKPVVIDGCTYVHYFIAGASDRAVSSAAAMLRRNGTTAIQGHNQKTDVAFHPYTHQWGIFVGVCNQHDEGYLGFQGNKVRKQIVVLHEVEAGKCDPMFVSVRFLEKAYS